MFKTNHCCEYFSFGDTILKCLGQLCIWLWRSVFLILIPKFLSFLSNYISNFHLHIFIPDSDSISVSCVFLPVKNFSSSLLVLGWTGSKRLVLCRHSCSQCWWWCSWCYGPSGRTGPHPAQARCDPPASWPWSACNHNILTLHTSPHHPGIRSQL